MAVIQEWVVRCDMCGQSLSPFDTQSEAEKALYSRDWFTISHLGAQIDVCSLTCARNALEGHNVAENFQHDDRALRG